MANSFPHSFLSLSYPICFFWRNMHERAFETIILEYRNESTIALLGMLIRSPFRIFVACEEDFAPHRLISSNRSSWLLQAGDDHSTLEITRNGSRSRFV